MTEKEYRELSDLDYFSYSLLKRFDSDGPLSLISPKEVKNKGVIFGNIVDALITDEENFEQNYHVSTAEKQPTITEAVFINIIEGEVDSNLLKDIDYLKSEDFTQLALDIIDSHSLWKNIKEVETRKSKITNNLIQNILDSALADEKTIISTEDFLNAEYAVKVLKENEFTKDYVLTTDQKKKQILFQIPILYTIHDNNFKSLLDMIVIDYENKNIRFIDLKTGYHSNKEFIYNFFKYRYDIQAGLYQKALEQFMMENDLKSFTILQPIYLYIGRNSLDSPLPFIINNNVIENSYRGFSRITGSEVKGIVQLIEEIQWHRSKDIYHYTKEEFERGEKEINSFDLRYEVNSQVPLNMFREIFNLYNRNHTEPLLYHGNEVVERFGIELEPDRTNGTRRTARAQRIISDAINNMGSIRRA